MGLATALFFVTSVLGWALYVHELQRRKKAERNLDRERLFGQG